MALSRFSTLPAQPKAIDAIDIDSCCCPTVLAGLLAKAAVPVTDADAATATAEAEPKADAEAEST